MQTHAYAYKLFCLSLCTNGWCLDRRQHEWFVVIWFICVIIYNNLYVIQVVAKIWCKIVLSANFLNDKIITPVCESKALCIHLSHSLFFGRFCEISGRAFSFRSETNPWITAIQNWAMDDNDMEISPRKPNTVRYQRIKLWHHLFFRFINSHRKSKIFSLQWFRMNVSKIISILFFLIFHVPNIRCLSCHSIEYTKKKPKQLKKLDSTFIDRFEKVRKINIKNRKKNFLKKKL